MASATSYAAQLASAQTQPGTAASAAAATPLGTVNAKNQTYAAMLAAAQNPGLAAAAQRVATQNAKPNWLHRALSAIDLPRAAVASGINALVNHDDSFSDWLKGTEQHITTGQILKNDFGIKNRWVNDIAGTVGDIAEDPLSYVGGIGEAAKAVGAAGHVADAVSDLGEADRAAQGLSKVRDAVDEGSATEDDLNAAQSQLAASQAKATASAGATFNSDGSLASSVIGPDTMERVTTGGIQALAPEERSFIEQAAGVRPGALNTGLGVTLPGSKLAKRLGMLDHPVTFKVANTDKMVSHIKNFAANTANSKSLRAIEDKLGGETGLLKNMVRERALAGDGEGAAALAQVMRHNVTQAGVAQQVVNKFGRQGADALDALGKDNEGDAAAALEGNEQAAARIANNGGDIGPLRQVFADLAEEAQKHGADIPTLEDYFPHQLTEAAKASGAGRTASRKTFENELHRTYTKGSKFLGRTLDEGSVEEMNRISKEIHGEDAADLFNSDPRQVFNKYLHGMASRIGRQSFANKLDELGVTAGGDAAKTPEDWVKLGEKGADAGRAAPAYVKDALDKIAEMRGAAKGSTALGKNYDKLLNVWKAWSLAAPGKAMRHGIVAPLWGTFLGNAGDKLAANARQWTKFTKALDAAGGDVGEALKTVPEADRQTIQDFLDHGLGHGRRFNPEKITGPKTKVGKLNAKIHNPLSTKSAYFRLNGEAQQRMQDAWRYNMFKDATTKGSAAPEAAAKVRHMLGDPHAISSLEAHTIRRAVPFYTFLRQNIPTELHNMITQPGKFENAVTAPSQELNQMSPQAPGSIIPSSFIGEGAVPLPFKIGGNQVFGSLDLPFSRLGDLTPNLGTLFSNESPIVSALIEKQTGVNPDFGDDSTPSPYGKAAPEAWSKIPGLMDALSHIPGYSGDIYKTTQPSTDYGVTTPAGTWEMTSKGQDLLENLFPLASAAKGVFTQGDPGYATSGDTNLINQLVGGFQLHTNDPRQQEDELYRRQAILKKMIEGAQNKGQLPAYIEGFHA